MRIKITLQENDIKFRCFQNLKISGVKSFVWKKSDNFKNGIKILLSFSRDNYYECSNVLKKIKKAKNRIK